MDKREWGLGSDTLFDGYFFRNLMGEVLPGHPKKQEILEEYLKSENDKITAENEIKKEKEKYRRKFYSNM